MKKYFLCIMVALVIVLSACSDWLEVLPKNQQLSEDYWKKKSDVEAVLGTGYAYIRNMVPTLINWGELRGGSVYAYRGGQELALQNFKLTPESNICSWATLYKIIGVANSVIEFAPGVMAEDDTYLERDMNAHLCEAYFQRALAYFYMVRNFKEAPLILKSYVDDSTPYDYPKSSEEEIIAQIKADISAALSNPHIRGSYADNWANKGRATRWAFYALMADVCLWSGDYDGCIENADKLLTAGEVTSGIHPVFIADSEQWASKIFYEGFSNESIFEIYYDVTNGQGVNAPSVFFGTVDPSGGSAAISSSTYQFTPDMCTQLMAEDENFDDGTGGTSIEENSVRGFYRTYCYYKSTDGSTDGTVPPCLIWKYRTAGSTLDYAYQRNFTDEPANFIIYRMSDVILMKAEALVWKGGRENWEEAVNLVNKIRSRAKLKDWKPNLDAVDELTLLEGVLKERDIELAAEGKRWYDLVRLGKSQDYRYKKRFIEIIVERNITEQDLWIESTLQDNYAWFLPIHIHEIETNHALVQNPYYKN